MSAPRHVFLMCVDALRFDALSSEPERVYLRRFGLDQASSTPNLDRFAKEGFRFSRCRSVASLTTPSVSSIFTGQYPYRHGVRLLVSKKLPRASRTLAEAFRERGFATFSSVDPAPLLKLAGLDRGFDAVFPASVPDEVVLDSVAKERQAGKPTFTYMHFCDVHAMYGKIERPIDASDNLGFYRDFLALLRKYKIRLSPAQQRVLEKGSPQADAVVNRYRGPLWTKMSRVGAFASEQFQRYLQGVNRFDSLRFDRVVKGLERRGFLKDSLLVITADHGEALPPSELVPDELRPRKGHHFWHAFCLIEELLRVPLIFWAPAGSGLRSGTCESHVSSVDIAPTLAGLFDLSLAGGSIDGIDRSALLRESARSPSKLRLARADSASYAEAWHENWKEMMDIVNRIFPLLLEGAADGPQPRFEVSGRLFQRSIRSGPLKLVLTRDRAPALYHTDRDPHETFNLMEFSQEYREIGGRLKDRIAATSGRRGGSPSGSEELQSLVSQLTNLGYL